MICVLQIGLMRRAIVYIIDNINNKYINIIVEARGRNDVEDI